MADARLNLLITAKDTASKLISKLNEQIKILQKQITGVSASVTGKVGDEFVDAAEAAEELGTNLGVASAAAIGITAESSSFVTVLKTANEEATKFGNKLIESAKSTGLIIASILSVNAGLAISVKSFLSLDEAIGEVSTLIGDAKISNDELTDSVIELSNRLGVDAIEVAEGLYQAISAGATAGADANNLLEVAIKTAIGGATTTSIAIDGLTSILSAYGLETTEAARVSDALFTTMKGGKTTIGELSQNLSQAIPIAASLGVSFEEVLGSVQTLTLASFKTPQAFTSIKAAMTSLIRPSKELDIIFSDFKGAAGALKEVGFEETLKILAEATGGSADEILKLVGSVEALNAIVGLTGTNADRLSKAIEDIEGGVGTATEAFDKMQKLLSGQINKAMKRVGNLFKVLGSTFLDTVIDLINFIGELSVTMQEWVKNNQALSKFLIVVIPLVALFGAALVGLAIVVSTFVAQFSLMIIAVQLAPAKMKPFLTLFGLLKKAFTATGTALVTFGGAFSGTFKKIGGVLAKAGIVGLILAAVAAIGFFIKNLFDLNEAAEKTTKELRESEKAIQDYVQDDDIRSVKAFTDEVKNLGDETKATLSTFISEGNKIDELNKKTIASLEKQIKAHKEAADSFFVTEGMLGDLDALQKRLVIAKFNQEKLAKSMQDLGAKESIVSRETATLTQTIEELSKAFDDSSSAINKVSESLKSVIKTDFSELLTNLESQFKAQEKILIASKASEAKLISSRLIASQTILRAKEAEVTAQIAEERRRVNAQRTLILSTFTDQEEVTERLRQLNISAAESSLKFGQASLANFREQAESLRNQVNTIRLGIINAAQETVDRLKSINDKIRDSKLNQLSDIQKQAAIERELTKKNAEIELALEQRKADLAKKLQLEALKLIDERAFVAEDSAGNQLQIEAQVDAIRIKALKEQAKLTLRIGEVDKEVREQGLKDTEAGLAKVTLTIEKVRSSLQRIQDTTVTVNIATNAEEVEQAFSEVSDTLGSLENRKFKIDIVPANIQSKALAEVFSKKTFTLKTEFTGIDKLNEAAKELEATNTRILEDVTRVLAQIRAIGTSVSGGSARGFVGGGQVFGPGTGTSDSIFAKLSSGEFVVRAAAVQKYGAGLFNALNNMQMRLPRFAEGGPVTPSTISNEGSRDIVDIRLSVGNDIFNLQGERDAARNMAKALSRMSNGLSGG